MVLRRITSPKWAGSTPPRNSRFPATLAWAKRVRTTDSTPGAFSALSLTLGEKPCPIRLLITRSPTKFFAMLSSTLAFADAPAMDMVATSAIPIISAEAVAAVRRGLRSEFCPASRPTLPNTAR